MGTLFLILAGVVLVGAWIARKRVRAVRSGRRVVSSDPLLRELLDDDAMRALDDDEPLDEEEARRAEDEFWERDWDDSEEWRG